MEHTHRVHQRISRQKEAMAEYVTAKQEDVIQIYHLHVSSIYSIYNNININV